MLKFSLKMVRTRSMSKSDSDSVETTPNVESASSSTGRLHPVSIPLPPRELPPAEAMLPFKSKMFNLFKVFVRVGKGVSMMLGVIGGVHALYEQYLSSFEQPVEKLEVLVLRRSY